MFAFSDLLVFLINACFLNQILSCTFWKSFHMRCYWCLKFCHRLELGIETSLVSPSNMKSKFKNGWRSIAPLHMQGESAMRFSMFPKVKSASYSPGNTPVYLNVYDLTPINGYFYWAGVGVFHSGVEGRLML